MSTDGFLHIASFFCSVAVQVKLRSLVTAREGNLIFSISKDEVNIFAKDVDS